MESIKIWVGNIGSYKLLDSGNQKKLEEINGQKIVRNEPRAWWKKKLPEKEWCDAQTSLETVIDVGLDSIKARIKFKETSKHIGIFPEQIREWQFIKEKIKKETGKNKKVINILNLFGYTGIVSLVAAKAGLSREVSPQWKAKITHIDASKQSIDWARENQKLSGLENAPIRWIVDDVVKFLKKEIKRQKNLPTEERGYDAIIMDPPSYGRGPKGEVWKIEDELPKLLNLCREILSDKPLFVIFNMYSTELSSISVANLLGDTMKDLNGRIECGELAIKHENFYSDRNVEVNHLLPMSIFALWENTVSN